MVGMFDRKIVVLRAIVVVGRVIDMEGEETIFKAQVGKRIS